MTDSRQRRITISGVQTTAIWTAGLCALAGTGFMVAFVSSRNPQPFILTAAVIAATLGVVSLLIRAVIVDVLLAGRRFESGIYRTQPALPGHESAQREAARLQKRLQVLDNRLNLDEPRLCSQYMIRCTCWSLCGGLPEQNYAAGESTSGLEERRCGTQSEAKTLPLQVVFRQGRDDCPFRFESPLGRPMRPTEKKKN